MQLNVPIDTSLRLTQAASLLLQLTVGSLLFYNRAVNLSMLPGLNKVSTQQSDPTINTLLKVTQLLDYVATHSNAVIRFHKSDMCLHVDSDTTYLVLPKACSRLAGHFSSVIIPNSNVPSLQLDPFSLNAKRLEPLLQVLWKLKPMGYSINSELETPSM